MLASRLGVGNAGGGYIAGCHGANVRKDERFQAQISDISDSSMPGPMASSTETSVSMVRPELRPAASSVETKVSTVRPWPT